MIPRPLAEVLGHLVGVAGRLVDKPWMLITLATELDAIEIEIAAWIRRPAEGVRLIDDRAAWLILAVRAAGNTSGEERDGWAKLAGYLLEHVRGVLARAIEARPTP